MAAAVAGLRASYHRLLDRIELMLPPRFRPFYNHPAGPKTVFFWAPIMKWEDLFKLTVKFFTGNLKLLSPYMAKAHLLQLPKCAESLYLRGTAAATSIPVWYVLEWLI